MGIFSLFRKQIHTGKKYKVGDTIFFGKYFFESEKDIRPIEWIVLEVNETELLLISKYCLDTVKYCEPASTCSGEDCCIWENSYLRNWLNQAFYNQAFSKKEKRAIKETEILTDKRLNPQLHRNKVFVLSQAQVSNLFSDEKDRIGFPTAYALQKGASIGYADRKSTWWWILPHIDETEGQAPRTYYPCVVCQDGRVHYHGRLIYHADFTVRPVIKIVRENTQNRVAGVIK